MGWSDLAAYLPAIATTMTGAAMMSTPATAPMGAVMMGSGIAQGGATYAGGKAAEKEAKYWAQVEADDIKKANKVGLWNAKRKDSQQQSSDIRRAKSSPDAARYQGGVAGSQMVAGATKPLYGLLASQNQAKVSAAEAAAARSDRMEMMRMMMQNNGGGRQRQPWDIEMMDTNQRVV